MILENKLIGIVFVNDPEIKESFEYELRKIKLIYNNVILIPIVKESYFNKNIDKFLKITKNKPLFYNKGIILEKTIKKLDILILVGCSDNIIKRLLNKKFNSNLLKIIKYSRLNKIPIIIGVDIKNFDNISLKNIEFLCSKKDYFFIPFKITNPITNPDKVSFETSLISKTILFASENIQIKPLISVL